MQTIKRHTFKRTDEAGETYICRAFGEDLADVTQRNYTKGDGYEYQGTEEIPYLYGEVAHAIAKALPAKWTAKPQSEEHPNCNWNLERYDGVTLYLSGPSYSHDKAYSFGVIEPRYNGSFVEAYDENNKRIPRPEINCATTKSPEQLAKDIVRRLLPDAEKVHDAVVRRIQILGRQDNAREQAITTLAGAAGVKVPRENYSKERPIYLDSVTFNIGHDGSSVQIAGYVPFEAAVRIADVLKKKGASK